jgi:hypothetical protein
LIKNSLLHEIDPNPSLSWKDQNRLLDLSSSLILAG